MATTKKTTSKEPKAAAKPAEKKKATAKKETAAPAKKAPVRETLTAEEKARVKKLKETLALLKADPEWPKFLQEQKQALLNLRDEMLPNMQNVTRDHLRSGASNVSSSSGQHIGDAGADQTEGVGTVGYGGNDLQVRLCVDDICHHDAEFFVGIRKQNFRNIHCA